MMSARKSIALALGAAALLAGLARLSFDADVLNLLPDGLDSVRGLKLHQKYFGGADDTLITISAGDADLAETAARSLAERLRQSDDAVAAAEWRSQFLEAPEAVTETLSWIWLNRPNDEFERLAERFAPGTSEEVLLEAWESLATTFSPEEIARLGRDPFGLTKVSADRGGMNADLMRDAEHRSADGKFRVVRVRSHWDLEDYRECARWMEFLQDEIRDWRNSDSRVAEVVTGITGGPAFVAETSRGMEADMRKMTPLTAGAIALLFLAAHRRLLPLAWLLALLGLTLLATLAMGGAGDWLVERGESGFCRDSAGGDRGLRSGSLSGIEDASRRWGGRRARGGGARYYLVCHHDRGGVWFAGLGEPSGLG